jgi:hypothetical protein
VKNEEKGVRNEEMGQAPITGSDPFPDSVLLVREDGAPAESMRWKEGNRCQGNRSDIGVIFPGMTPISGER